MNINESSGAAMIFAIIDLLEKLLGWLKPFASKEQKPSIEEGLREEVPLADVPPLEVPLTGDARELLQGLLPRRRGKLVHTPGELPIISDFIDLYNDEDTNKNPIVPGRIFTKDSEQSLFPAINADLAVWYSLSLRWSNQYTIKYHEA